LKILASSLACSPHFGSESLVGFRALEALSDRYDVTLITSARMEPPGSISCHRISLRFDQPNDVSAWQLLWFERRQRRLVDRLLRDEQFDVLHRVTPSGYKDSFLRPLALPLILGPVLLCKRYPPAFRRVFRPALKGQLSPSALIARLRHGVASRVFARLSTANALLESATCILVGTTATLEQLPSHIRPRCRLFTYAGIENKEFRPASHNKQNRVPQLLFVGRIVPYKGVELLLRAVAVAKLTGLTFELKIVGQATPICYRYFTRLAEQLGLSGCVSFVANRPRSDLIELYQNTDVFCLPSTETYGIAILEAMSCGCAVLVSDINGPGEIVRPGTGLKVPLETPDQFIEEYASRIIQLVGDPQLRAELGMSAREHVVREHDWGRIQSRLLEIYEEIFSRHGVTEQSAPKSVATSAR
jgi:glycosyltransferase involved in cell wall biosynthesis